MLSVPRNSSDISKAEVTHSPRLRSVVSPCSVEARVGLPVRFLSLVACIKDRLRVLRPPTVFVYTLLDFKSIISAGIPLNRLLPTGRTKISK